MGDCRTTPTPDPPHHAKGRAVAEGIAAITRSIVKRLPSPHRQDEASMEVESALTQAGAVRSGPLHFWSQFSWYAARRVLGGAYWRADARWTPDFSVPIIRNFTD